MARASAPPGSRPPSELESSADAVGNEGLLEAGRQRVLGSPTGAVGLVPPAAAAWLQDPSTPGYQRFEERTVEVKAAEDCIDGTFPGEAMGSGRC